MRQGCCNIFATCLCLLIGTVASGIAPIRAYSVFGRDQVELHKYAAILAASEHYRSLRNKAIEKLMNPISFWFCNTNSKEFNNHDSKLRRTNSKVDSVCEAYEAKLLDLVYSYGLDPDSFNSLSIEIAGIAPLKKKVLQQANFYKFAAVLDSDLVSTVKAIGPKGYVSAVDYSSQLKKPGDTRHDNELIRQFAAALKEIEADRLEVRNELMVHVHTHTPLSLFSSSPHCFTATQTDA